MVWMSVILGSLFMGISLMAYHYGIIPKEDETVVSQLARLTFGTGLVYYVIQVGTMTLLVLAANSAFAGFPHLASILARDGFMPHQMATFGDRLVFSNGIIILGFFACLLLVIFQGDTHALIPLYAIGVFVSFSLSQAGMERRWVMKKGLHWRKKLIVNGIGAITTGIATTIIAVTKFMQGAWIVFLLVAALIMMFRAIRSHYKAVADAAGDLPFFVYNLPQLTQVETVPALMEKFMREIPTLKGLKHSAPNFAHIRVFADMGLICFNGNGAFPLPALTMGAVGTIDAPLALVPWHYVELHRAWEAGDLARAQSLQDGVRKYVDLVWMFNAFPDVCKAVLSKRLGIDCGRSIPPVNGLNEEERVEVLRVAESLGVTVQRAPAVAGGRAARKLA